jgi:hypothetical protein
VISYGAADRHLAGLAALLDRAADAARHFQDAQRLNAAMGMRPWLERMSRPGKKRGMTGAKQP